MTTPTPQAQAERLLAEWHQSAWVDVMKGSSTSDTLHWQQREHRLVERIATALTDAHQAGATEQYTKMVCHFHQLSATTQFPLTNCLMCLTQNQDDAFRAGAERQREADAKIAESVVPNADPPTPESYTVALGHRIAKKIRAAPLVEPKET